MGRKLEAWWARNVWDADPDGFGGLPWRYQPLARFLLRPLCWFRWHLGGPGGLCTRCGWVCDTCGETLTGRPMVEGKWAAIRCLPCAGQEGSS